jgi:hypothetical protein
MKVKLKPDKNKGQLTKNKFKFLIISLLVFFEREMLQGKGV